MSMSREREQPEAPNDDWLWPCNPGSIDERIQQRPASVLPLKQVIDECRAGNQHELSIRSFNYGRVFDRMTDTR